MVQFLPFSPTPDAQGQATVQAAIAFAKANPLDPMTIDGFHYGQYANQFDTIREQRVRAVLSMLVDGGISGARISILGEGMAYAQDSPMPSLPLLAIALSVTATVSVPGPALPCANIPKVLPSNSVRSIEAVIALVPRQPAQQAPADRPCGDAHGEAPIWVVERNGRLITTREVEKFRRLPKLVGAGAPQAAADLVDAVQAHRAIAARIAAYARVSDRRWNLILDDGVTVELPESGWQKELDSLDHLIIDNGILERDVTEIDLRSPTHYFFLLKSGEKKDVERGKET